MIILNWAQFPGSDVQTYKIFRSMIGFSAPNVNLAGKTLILRTNGGPLQTISFTSSDIVDTINAALQCGSAYITHDTNDFIVRSDVRVAPGSIEIVGGTALPLLGLTPRLIEEKSEDELIAVIAAPENPDELLHYTDYDGVLQDYYAISTTNGNGEESNKSMYRQAITTTGPICVIEGLIVNAQGIRMPDVEVIATVQVPPERKCELIGITKEPIKTVSNPDGRFSLPLLHGLLVRLEIPAVGYGRMITVPDKAYVFLNNLLVDEEYQSSLGYT